MNKRFKTIILIAVSSLILGCGATTAKQPTQTLQPPVLSDVENAIKPMRVATWNVEHLAYPIEKGCRPRTAEEIAKLKMYAKNLDAHIVGLQEVGSETAVRQLFPEDEWQIIMSDRPENEPYECRENGFSSTQQKVAFAVKKDIEVLKVTNHSQFGLDRPGLRYGLAITVKTPLGATEILNLHLKSGCFVDNYTRKESEACERLGKQIPLLQALVAQYEASGKPYMLIGDFNHRLTASYNRMTQMLKSSAESLSVATQNMLGCHPWYPAPIDNVLVGNTNSDVIARTAQAIAFEDMTVDNMLSDHCAVSVDLVSADEMMSPPLVWVRKSKEFELMSLGIYKRAEESLEKLPLPDNNWVVVMDIDETVLDNTGYERWMNSIGKSYQPETWDIWVASEQATLVPGAKSFIEKVFELGGKVGFVTNREKTDDNHTWNNLVAQGIPVTPENSCLMGRSPADVESEHLPEFINDKDLRRKQIREGTADCYTPDKKASDWQTSHVMIMQVGDNIEDIEGVTQDSAVPEELLKRLDKDIIILLNPVYGSW